jgi:hypothetical protein
VQDFLVGFLVDLSVGGLSTGCPCSAGIAMRDAIEAVGHLKIAIQQVLDMTNDLYQNLLGIVACYSEPKPLLQANLD